MSIEVPQITGAAFDVFKGKKRPFISLPLPGAVFNFWNKPWTNTANAQTIDSKTSLLFFDLVGFFRHF